MNDELDKLSWFIYGDTEGNKFFIYTDLFDRKWKLTIVTNELIQMPFVITPIGDEK